MIAVVIGSESSLSLSVSTQSQGGHQQFDVGVGGSEIRPGQRFQVQDHPDRAGLGGAWEEHCVTTLQRTAAWPGRSSGERRERESLIFRILREGGPFLDLEIQGDARHLQQVGVAYWSIFYKECAVWIRIISQESKKLRIESFLLHGSAAPEFLHR